MTACVFDYKSCSVSPIKLARGPAGSAIHPTPAVVDGCSFAYLALRPVDEATVEFGAHAFGPDAAALAEALANHIRFWDRDHRGGPGPRFAAYPADTPDEQLPDGLFIAKRHVRVLISWPPREPLRLRGDRVDGGPLARGVQTNLSDHAH